MIIVTGGAGFIGSNLIAGLAQAGESDIVVCDWLGDGDKWRNIAGQPLADVIMPEALPAYLDAHRGDIDAIFHLGAISATTETDVDLIVRNNVRLSLDLWDWCTRHQVRFIYASSAATYGDGANGFDDDGSPEGLSGLAPMNPYGWSKHMVDRRVADICSRGDACPPQWAGLKFFNVYGPNEYHKDGMRSVAVQLYERISSGEPARLFRSHNPDYEDGGQMRDFIWVGDCVDIMLWLLKTPKVSGLFNAGTGKARSFADLANATFRALDKPPRIEFIDTPGEIRHRYQYFTEAETGRLRQAGYDTPFTELEDGVARYVQDYLATENPYV